MSDSDLSDLSDSPHPTHEELEQSLRREVARTVKAGADVTVKRIRTASENKLGLPEGFYKSHATWKDLSKTIIEDQVNGEDEDEEEDEEPDWPVSSAKPKPTPGKRTKRKSAEVDSSSANNKQKKRKVSEEAGDSDAPSEAAIVDQKQRSEANRAKQSVEPEEGNVLSDSDLSVLLDEEPAKKKKQKTGKSKSSREKPKQAKQPKQAARSKSKAKDDNDDPDQAEIKRLQGWLVKCGIRKVWSRELSSYDTPKAKIRHLKEMLSDVGMSGRFSVDKANRIKEQREMEADIEAIKEGEERWGAGDQDVQDKSDRPARKLVRGSQHLDFLSEDDEETD